MAQPDPFRSPFVGEDPIQRAQRISKRQQNWRNTVLRRQRILKARGYNVPVDGNWGKRTSSAWWRLNRGMPPLAGRQLPTPVIHGEDPRDKARVFRPEPAQPPKPVLPASPATQLQAISQRAVRNARQKVAQAKQRTAPPDLSHAAAKALAAAPRQRHGLLDPPAGAPSVLDAIPTEKQTKARNEVVRTEITAQANARFDRAWKKRDDPSKWDSRDIVALFADPLTRVNHWEQKGEWVGKLQRFLIAHGANIPLTGLWDAQTSDALRNEMLRRKRNFERFRANQLARRIYRPLGIKPGEKGFPMLGTAPTPEKLLQMADQGGFAAQFVFKQLAERLNDLNLASSWRRYQDEYLDSLLVGGKGIPEARSVFGPFLSDIVLDEMTPSQKYAAILLGFSSIGEQQRQQIGEGFSVENDPTKKGDTFYQEVRAVAEATSVDDLKHRVALVRAADEKTFQVAQAWKEANRDWFADGAGAVAHALGVPAEEAQDALVAASAAWNSLVEGGITRAGRGQGFGDQETALQLFHEEHARLQATWDAWEKTHPVYSFGVDLIVDPLNLIPAAWLAHAWQGTKAGVKAVEAAGEITRVATKERALPVRLLGETAGATLQLPAAYGRHVGAGLAFSKQAIKESKVGRLGRSVRETVDDVTRTVGTAFHYGFSASRPGDAADVAKTKDYVRDIVKNLEATDPTTGRKFRILDEIERFGVGTVQEMTSLFTDFVNLASRERLSLYTHSSRQTVSDFGASSRATFASFVRAMEVDKYAANLAKEAYDNAFNEAMARSKPTVEHRIPTIRDAQRVAMPDDEFIEQAQKIAENHARGIYRDAVKAAGTYFGGGNFEVMKLIQARVLDRLDLWNTTLAPALQDAIEHSYANAVAEGKAFGNPSLFTTDGDYAFANRSNTVTLLRDLLRDTFDDLDVKYGAADADRVLSGKTMKKLRSKMIADIDEEFRHRLAQLDEQTAKLAADDEELVKALGGLRIPVLVNKRDGAVIFGSTDVQKVLDRGDVAKDYLLTQARLTEDLKVDSLSAKIVDLESGELKYEPADFADDAPTLNGDPKFRKAIDDLKAIDKRISALERRKKSAGRAQTAEAKAHGWTAQDQADLDAQFRAKRNLIKNNPATEGYFARGKAKRSVARAIEGLRNKDVAGGIEAKRAVLREEKEAAIRAADDELRQLAEESVDSRARMSIEVTNVDEGRVFTADEYDEFQAMMFDIRQRSVAQWAARRRAVGDMDVSKLDEIVERELDDYAEQVKGWFVDQGDGTFKMTVKRIKVPAIYARHHFKAYDDALKGAHPMLTAADVPDDVKRILSLSATPADRAPGAVDAMERIAAMASGARPYPVWKKFSDIKAETGRAVQGRKLTFERASAARVGLAEGTQIAEKVGGWANVVDDISRAGWEFRNVGGGEPTDFVARYDAYRALLKVASQHAYSHVTLRQGAMIRALKEAQSGPLREINNLLNTGRELFVFSVLPGRPAALFRNVFDSVVKIITIGYTDPRYWFVSGATNGEIAARNQMKAVSSELRGAIAPAEGSLAGRAYQGYQDAVQKAERMLDGSYAASLPAKVRDDVLSTVTNVFQLGINELDAMIRLMVGPKYADAVATTFRHAVSTAFWARPLREVQRMLKVNGVEIPDEAVFGVQTILKDGVETKALPREKVSLEDWAAINGVKQGDVERWVKEVTADPKRLNDTRHPVFVMMSHLSDVSWDLMVGRPEGRLRRGLYAAAYSRTLRKTGDKVQATAAGMKAIDKSLFDYSKITVLDENLRHLIPFYFFWRRNLAFWATEAIRKPYLPASLVKFDEMMEQVNSDQPEWSRRYLRIPFLNDTLAKLPVAGWLLNASGGFEVGTDPLSWISAAPLYRAFKGSNPTLPADKSGLPFISGLVEGMNDFGLSMSPWFRKPLELTGVLDYRAWQAMFPQTTVAEAFSQRFLTELFPEGLNFEEVLQDSLFEAVGIGLSAKELNEKRVNEMVQLEMSAQAERGQPVDRAAAEKKVRQFIYLQTIFAFSSGAYLRQLDPAQLHLYNIQTQLVLGEIDFLDLTPEEQKAYRLFVRRKFNAGAYDQYVKTVPKIEAYYALEDFDRSQEYLQENPEVIPYVSPERQGKPAFRGKALKNVSLVADTGAALATLKVFDAAGIDEPGVRDRLQTHFVTPELEAFWARNDTPKERRDRMLKGEVFGYLRGLRQDYFDIPEKDHAARSQFLQDNPLLAHSFTVNDNASDDFKDVINYVNNDLREVYFEFVEKKDWDGAAAFLKRFPRIFEFTKAEDRVTDDGTWLPSKKQSQHSKDFLAARRFIQHYFDLKKRNKQLAFKWLNGNTPGAKLTRDYFQKYADPTKGTKTEHAKDYLAVKPLLSWFFDSLPKEGEFRGHFSKWDWVFNSDDPAAVQLRNYFRKYGDKAGMSQHAKDYVSVRSKLQHYFQLKEKDAGAANEWLHSDAGSDVIAYFKKYGKTNAAARKWGSWVRSQNPEVNRRLMFWKRYFELTPDERPGFVHRAAAQYGIFIWGPEADRDRHEKEQAYVRAAKKRHLTPKSAMYLKVKPLLEMMHGLSSRDKKILLRLNPDLREYIERYSKGPDTGSKELDGKLERYFSFPPDGQDRADFLRKNPDVQDYFDKKNPADAAMHNLLEVYFAIPVGKERNQYRDLHPEISDYFDRKREEKSLLTAELRAFDDADPRDVELRAKAQFEIVHAAEVMWAKLRGDGATRLAGDDIQVRRERDEQRRKNRRLTL